MKSRRPVNSTVMLLSVSQRSRGVNGWLAVTAIVFLVSICCGQQRQSAVSSGDQDNVARDAGFLFYMYDKSVGVKERNESLDALAMVLRESPNLMAYLISYGADKRANSFKQRLTTVGKIEPARVEIIHGRNCSPWRIDLMKWSTAAEKPAATVGCLHSNKKSNTK